jgi:hypothetical protein
MWAKLRQQCGKRAITSLSFANVVELALSSKESQNPKPEMALFAARLPDEIRVLVVKLSEVLRNTGII